MLDTIANILQQECKLHLTDKLLVGVSGGPDSLCLLHLLHKLGHNPIAAHLNHHLRPEADQEAEIVKQFAAEIGVESVCTDIDVRMVASQNSISIEEAARTVRYRYLFEQAELKAAAGVLVAHTADDQVETILMHLLRGSGLSGLRGMDFRMLPNPWSDCVPLIRPLLSTWREDILEYLAINGIVPVSDQSNLDTTYFRNRLRHDLLPILESYNPRVRKNLLRAGLILRDDYLVLQQLVDEAWEGNLVWHAPGTLAFHRQGILELPLSLQRYMFRKALAYFIPGLRDVDYECIERGLKFLAEAKSDGQVDLMSGIRIIREDDLFWLASSLEDLPLMDYPSINKCENIPLIIPSIITLNDGWQLDALEAPDLDQALQDNLKNQDSYQVWLDIGKIELPLTVRCRVAGDRIQPVGMDGHSIKISDLMINLKLPKRARKTWPMVCSGDHILWIPGGRVSQLVQVNADSRSVIHLMLSRNLSA